MPNVHSLSDLKKKARREDDAAASGGQPADYYAGGVGNDGGGSGVAIQMPGDPISSIVRNASASASSGGGDGNSSSAESGISLELYRNGFIIVNQGKRGEFRSKDDPANHTFLADLRRGDMPAEIEALTNASGTGSQRVALLNHSETDFKVPPKPKEAFSGGGQKLSAPSYDAVAESGSVVGPKEIQLKEGEKVVKMRVKLSTGQNLTISCNGSHTVGDIKAHVQFHSGGAGSGEFLLLSGRPPQPLVDLAATVDEAKLRGASVIQRMK